MLSEPLQQAQPQGLPGCPVWFRRAHDKTISDCTVIMAV